MVKAMNAEPATRIDLELKEALRAAADREHRSTANMIVELASPGVRIPLLSSIFSDRSRE